MTDGSVQRFERIVLPHLDDAYTLARYSPSRRGNAAELHTFVATFTAAP